MVLVGTQADNAWVPLLFPLFVKEIMMASKKVVSEETVVETVVDPEVSVPPRDLLEAPLAEDFGSRMPFAEDIVGVKFGFQEAVEPVV